MSAKLLRRKEAFTAEIAPENSMILSEVAPSLYSRYQRLRSSLIWHHDDLWFRDLSITNLCSNDLKWRCFCHFTSVLPLTGLKLAQRTFVFLPLKVVLDIMKEVRKFCQWIFAIVVQAELLT